VGGGTQAGADDFLTMPPTHAAAQAVIARCAQPPSAALHRDPLAGLLNRATLLTEPTTGSPPPRRGAGFRGVRPGSFEVWELGHAVGDHVRPSKRFRSASAPA
jgi:hypothetical protein